MARAVSISSSVIEEKGGRYRVEYSLMNGSDYPIDTVVLLVASYDERECEPAEQSGCAAELVIGTMYSKQLIKDSVPVQFDHEPPFVMLTAMASVLFTDSWNQTWWRGPGYLERRNHPARIC